jgi:uncharacterized membrane protein YgcG
MKTKAVFFITFIFALLSAPVQAQSDNPPIPNRPPNGTYILDELNWLTVDQTAFINSLSTQLDNDGMAVLEIVTLSNCGADKKIYRQSILHSWGIGHPNKNDGLLILVCWYDGDKNRRSVEQEFGSGLNKFLTSEKTDQIAQQRFIPAFQQNRPGDGLVEMVKDYDSIFRKSVQKPSKTNLDSNLILVIVIVTGLFVATLFPKKRKPSDSTGDYYSDGGFDGGGGSDGGGSSTSF